MTLTQYIRDSVTHELGLTWPLGGAAFSPDGDWALIFTAKRRATAPDASALIQKASGAGITVGGSTASVAIVPADTTDLTATETFLCDVQAQHILTGEVRTVWVGRLKCVLDITRETTTSIPVHTTEPPLPFSNIAQSTHAAASKTTPVDADEIPLADSAATWALKKLTWANLKAALKAYLDAFYQAAGTYVTSVAGRTGDVTIASADIVDASASGSPAVAGKAVLFGSQGQLEADYFRSKRSSQYPVADYEADQIVFYPDEFSGGGILSFPSGSGTLMLGSNNLSDLTSASTARTNLGLGTTDSVTFRSITQGAGSTFNSGAVNVYLLAPNVWRNALELGESNNPRFANLTVSGTVKTTATVFASLPSAITAGAGARSFITDCNTTTFLATAAGGGASAVPVVSNGTNWLVG